MIFAAVVPSAALSEHLLTAGFWQSLKAPWVQHLWSTWRNVHSCVCLQGTTPEKNARRRRLCVKQVFIRRLCSFIFSSTGCPQLLGHQTISRAHRLNAEQYCSIAGSGFSFALLSHREPVVHANLSKTGSNRANVLFWKPGFEEFHCKARRNTWINAMRTRHVLPTDLQG